MFRYSSRFWLYAPLAAFLTLAALVMLHWWFAAGAFEKKMAALKGREAAPGITLDWGGVSVGGFPFRLDADFTDFRVHGAGAHGPFLWRSARFALHTLTYEPSKTVYEAAGPQHLEWADATGARHAADFLPATLHASSVVHGGALSRFDLDIRDADGNGFIAARLQFHLRSDPDGHDLDLMARADGLKRGGLPAQPVQAPVQAYVTLTHAAPLMPLLAGAASWPDAARAWHGAGGAVRLTQGIAPDTAAPVLSALY